MEGVTKRPLIDSVRVTSRIAPGEAVLYSAVSGGAIENFFLHPAALIDPSSIVVSKTTHRQALDVGVEQPPTATP